MEQIIANLLVADNAVIQKVSFILRQKNVLFSTLNINLRKKNLTL